MTIVVDGASTRVDQVHKQLEKLVRVLKVTDWSKTKRSSASLRLIKVHASILRIRAGLLDIAASFRANVVDLGSDTLVLEGGMRPGQARLASRAAQCARHV